LRLHAEQLTRSGGAVLAAELGAASADHIDHASDHDLAAMRAAGTSAVLLPGASFSMRLPFPDGRRIWDSGVTVALGTDCNPGTSFLETMPFVIALAVLGMGLTPEEAVWAATRGSAHSLRLDDRGWLGPGARADLVVLDAPSHRHLPYRPDGNLVARVVVGGEVVA
jgi:imidazolonepropionase